MDRGAARAVAACAIEPGLYHIAPGPTTAVSCRPPALCRRFPTRSDIPDDVPTDNTSLVCAGPERAGVGVRPRRRRRGRQWPLRSVSFAQAARRAWQPHPDHLQVPGRRQRPGLRPGLPGVRPFPRRRRRAVVDRRPRSVSADEPVEARAGDRVHAHSVHPGGPVHRRGAGADGSVLDARPAPPDAGGRGRRAAVVQGRDAVAPAAFGERVPALQGRLASGRGRARQHDRRMAVVEEGRRRCRSGIRRKTSCSIFTPTIPPPTPSRKAWR